MIDAGCGKLADAMIYFLLIHRSARIPTKKCHPDTAQKCAKSRQMNAQTELLLSAMYWVGVFSFIAAIIAGVFT